ncbi:MAG: hypothetical protein MR210_01625 [Erysipelotrichaceae bacterium]|nr:hypothetical protein [Erysipelotrichaceae bacterium]MDY5252832.1 hypothetical protein [Erysipelotrichaceae bacterium]
MKNSKKLVALMLSAVVLAGCTDGHAAISNANEKVFSVGNTTVTKGDVYSSMFNSVGTYTVISDVTQSILNANVPVTDEINAEADETMKSYETMYGEAINDLVGSYGYKDAQDYRDNGVVPSLQAKVLYKNYVNDNWDTIKSEKNPKKGVVIKVEDADTAAKVMTSLNEGKDLTEVITENSLTHSGKEELIYADSGYPVEVMTMINSATDSSYATVTCADGSIYVLNVTVSDAETIKDEVALDLAAKEDIQVKAMTYYVQQAGFEVYDRDLYDAIKLTYPDYLD